MNKRAINLKTKYFLLYLVQNMAIPTKTILIKMSYLCDLAACNSGRDKITNFKYIRYYYGPYDQTIEQYLMKLVNEDKINVVSQYASSGGEYEKFAANLTKEDEEKIEEYLGDDIKIIIDPLLESIGSLNAKMLTEVAYKTKPMTSIGATLGGKEKFGKELQLVC